MTRYDITVIYAHHDNFPADSADFPSQTLEADRIQLLRVQEQDVYHPHKNALAQIEMAKGTYTILLDEGDQLSADFLEQLLDRARKKNSAFCMPLLRFPADTKTGAYFVPTGITDPIPETLDASGLPYVFPIDLHGLLIPTEPLKQALALVTGTVEPEKQILLHLLAQNPCYEFVQSCTLSYAVPKECNAAFDIRCMTKAWYYEPFSSFLLPLLQKEAQHPSALYPFIQYLALYMVRLRFFSNRDNKNKHVLSPSEVPDYTAFLCEVMQYIDTSFIVEKRVFPTSYNSSSKLRLLELRMKKNDPNWYPELSFRNHTGLLTCDGSFFCSLKDFMVQINLIDYEAGKLVIDGQYIDLFSEQSAKVVVRFEDQQYPLTYNQRYSLTKYFGVSFSRTKTFHVEIPVKDSAKDRLLNFVLIADGQEQILTYGFPTSTSRFAKDFTYGYWRFDKYLAFWNDQGIHVVPSRKLLVLKKEIGLWIQMWKKKNGAFRDQIPMKIINFLLRPYFKKQKIWLFLDKIYKGGDSSEYIYKYAQKQPDGIKKYYLLDETAADYARMRKEGYRPLKRGTLKHHLIFLNSDLVIASNSTVFAFNDFTFDRSLAIRGDTHFQVACVQHGMSVQKIAIAQQRLRDNTRLYFCASKYEIENLEKPVYDYVGYDALKLTGVPRYDGLVDRKQKILLISPTWRMNSALPISKSEGFARDYNPNFKETNYYKVYNSLINDPRLLEAARQHGYRIQYVLHPIISPQAEDFTKNDLVEIIPSIGNMSYEKIFCEAALMVSDYSGVQFDFAYMRKPVVYLHHNDIPQHYEEGTFHYDTMSFGEICHTNEELIDVLIQYMERDCEMPEFYRRRADDFFAFSDHDNCARIYPIMLEYTKKKRGM